MISLFPLSSSSLLSFIRIFRFRHSFNSIWIDKIWNEIFVAPKANKSEIQMKQNKNWTSILVKRCNVCAVCGVRCWVCVCVWMPNFISKFNLTRENKTRRPQNVRTKYVRFISIKKCENRKQSSSISSASSNVDDSIFCGTIRQMPNRSTEFRRNWCGL